MASVETLQAGIYELKSDWGSTDATVTQTFDSYFSCVYLGTTISRCYMISASSSRLKIYHSDPSIADSYIELEPGYDVSITFYFYADYHGIDPELNVWLSDNTIYKGAMTDTKYTIIPGIYDLKSDFKLPQSPVLIEFDVDYTAIIRLAFNGYAPSTRTDGQKLSVPCTGEPRLRIIYSSEFDDIYPDKGESATFYIYAEQVVSKEAYEWFAASTAYLGTIDTKPVYKRVGDIWAKQTAYERFNGKWVRISTAEIISFTIDGVVYYAKSGMTWGEWCSNNEYSLNSWHIYGTKIETLDNTKYVSGVSKGNVITSSSYMTVADDGVYDIYIRNDRPSSVTIQFISDTPTTISRGEVVTTSFRWTINTSMPDLYSPVVSATNCTCEHNDIKQSDGVYIVEVTLSDAKDDVTLSVS